MGEFQDRFRRVMRETGFSQAELARRIGVSQPAINQILNSNADGWKYTVRAARAMGVSPDWLESGVGVSKVDKVDGTISLELMNDAICHAIAALVRDGRVRLTTTEVAEIARFVTMVCDSSRNADKDTIDTIAATNAEVLLSQFRV